MQILFFARKVSERNIPFVGEILTKFEQAGFDLSIYYSLWEQLEGRIQLPETHIMQQNERMADYRFEYMIVLGGDGSMLDATVLVRDLSVPIVGINLGRLGFLASIEKTMVDEVIKAMQRGSLQTEDRTLLALDSNPKIFKGVNFALNDFTLLKRDTSSMINIHTYINGEYLTTYWADGLIVSTPTGSTAYSLSCGGPIMFPSSESFIITPVAPHNLNIRPLIVPDSAVISFEVEGRSDNFLCTLDTRVETITDDYELAIRKNDFKVKLAHMGNASFLRTIREKLAWGKDGRN